MSVGGALGGAVAGGVAATYGEAYVLDVQKRRAIRLLDRGECLAAARLDALAY
jgi:hypothetical protein